MQDASIVIPVFNERGSVLRSIKSKLESYGAEVIIVDDGSKRPHKESLKHGVNFGYGAAILTGMKQSTRPLILTMDGDNQHTPQEAFKLYQAWKLIGNIDMLIGTRRLDGEKWYRYIGRKFLNTTASVIAGTWFQDLNSGMRIFKKDIAEGYASILCKQYSFTTSLTMSFVTDKYRVEWFPIKVQKRSFGSSKVRLWKHGWITLYYIVRIGLALRTRGLRAWLRKLRGLKA